MTLAFFQYYHIDWMKKFYNVKIGTLYNLMDGFREIPFFLSKAYIHVDIKMVAFQKTLRLVELKPTIFKIPMI